MDSMPLRVLLVNPPTPSLPGSFTPPLGISYVAAYLEAKGFQVAIYDMPIMDLGVQDFRKFLRENPFQAVGMTAFTTTLPSTFKLARVAKAVDPNIVTMVGGPHPTLDATGVIETEPAVDFAVRGEGELTTFELLSAVANGRNGFSEIKGIAYRENGKAVLTQTRPLVENLDSLPFPAKHLLPMKIYQQQDCPDRIIAGRGCPYRCTFCACPAIWSNSFRRRSLENVLEEIEQSMGRYGARWFRFADDTFTVQTKYVLDFCKAINDRGLSFKWDCYARIDTVNETLLEVMKEAGCWMMYFGVESADPAILKNVGKKITPERAKEAIAMANRAGIKVVASFILGLPGETRDTIRKTIEFAQDPNIDEAAFSILTPYPGTEIAANLAQYGIQIVDPNYENWHQAAAVISSGGISQAELIDYWLEARMSRKNPEMGVTH